jgi:hypothetical protein
MKAPRTLVTATALLVALLSMMSMFPAGAQQQTTIPEWYIRGFAAVLLDPYPGMLSELIRLPSVPETTSKIADAVGVEIQQRITARLLKQATDDKSGQEQFAAIYLLSFYHSSDPHLVLKTVLQLADSKDEMIVRVSLGVIARLGPTDKDEYQASLATLRKLMIHRDPEIQLSAIGALVRLTAGDVGQRNEVVDPLIKLTAIGSTREEAIQLLADVGTADEHMRSKILDALLHQSASDKLEIQYGVIRALSAIKATEPSQQSAVVDTLLRFAKTGKWDVGGEAASALGKVVFKDSAQRKVVIEALGALLKSTYRSTVNEAAESLASIAVTDDQNRADIVRSLVDLSNQSTKWAKESAAIALGIIGRQDQTRTTAIKELVRLAGAKEDGDAQTTAINSLSQITPLDKDVRQAFVSNLVDILQTGHGKAAAKALEIHQPQDEDQRRRAIDALFDVLKKSSSTEDNLAAGEVLERLTESDDAQRKVVIDTLIKRSFDDDTDSQQGAAAGLGLVTPRDPSRRNAVLETLLRLSKSGNSEVRAISTWALSKLSHPDLSGRRVMLNRFVELVGTTEFLQFFYIPRIRESSQIGLFRNGPLEMFQLIKVLSQLYAGDVNAVPYWRTIAWTFNGKLPYPAQELLADHGSVLLSFAGRIPDDQIPWPLVDGNPANAAKVLSAFNAHWDAIAEDNALSDDIIRKANTIVSRACPSAAKAPALSLETVKDDALRTLTWVLGQFTRQGSAICWKGDDRTTLESFLRNVDKLVSRGDLKPSITELHTHFDADGATPSGGIAVLGVLGWALLWSGFIVAFPHSARIRSIYLFNSKLRDLVSLWFVPVILTVLPPLRRRMLKPFRSDLLKDAQLGSFDEDLWFSNVFVNTANGAVENVTLAIADIRGTVILTGESGLGKSIFLRRLANGIKRNVVFLNASACDKGVLEAISQSVPSFQNKDFFEGLVYAKDLAVIIDGLNEASAETRILIASFANKAGGPDVLIATQPIEGIYSDRSPFVGAETFELLPLRYEDIAEFLKTRPIRNDATARVNGERYDNEVNKFLRKAVKRAASEEERSAAELIVSNPLDLTYASELIARGQLRSPHQLIDQAIKLAHREYRRVHDRDFPEVIVANKCVELRKEDRNWLKSDELISEQEVLIEFRLLVPRPHRESPDKQIIVMRFRHEKVMDALTKPAFDSDKHLQMDLVDDPRFRGVYLLYAQSEDRKTGQRLRLLLSSRAARTRDHTLSDEFIRRFELGETVKFPFETDFEQMDEDEE